jgi:hypothetical protein
MANGQIITRIKILILAIGIIIGIGIGIGISIGIRNAAPGALVLTAAKLEPAAFKASTSLDRQYLRPGFGQF